MGVIGMKKKRNPGSTVTAVAGALDRLKAGADLSKQNTLQGSLCQSAAAQRRLIFEHLQHGTMTTLQARDLGIMHPGMRVCELRKQGYEIVTEWAFEYCPGGILHRVARIWGGCPNRNKIKFNQIIFLSHCLRRWDFFCLFLIQIVFFA